MSVNIGLLAQQEVTWLLERSAETAWAQLTPPQQQVASREVVTTNAQAMVTQALATPGAAAFVAREGAEPLGYLLAVVVPDELTGWPTGLFLDVWVDPRYRGQALAARLSAAGEQHLRTLGINTVRRVVASHNEASLRHSYKDGCRVERLVLTKDIG